ncbi:hypothetical protein B0F90DRAFT_1813778 [Multifurca ochricompacta]|uniref:Uncharacterized protein n=1 Tax=Multifurca ochricompacta TaxID=376703 RepID=A0AAD4MD82_9AGAM|nr:hypothetical protein B0F90DRAFT_1813778 [Multifurca ochricompacta]
MASLFPAPSALTPSRLDWGHNGERASTSRGVSRSRGGAGRGDRGRGGRGGRRGGAKAHGSSPTEHNDNINASTTIPALARSAQTSAVPPPAHPSSLCKNTSSSLPQSAPGLALPAKFKAGPRRASQHAANKVPSLTIEPATPNVNSFGSAPHSASTSSSRPSTRSRRSHNKSPGATLSSENLTIEALASAMNPHKSPSGPSSPHHSHPKDLASKDPPPHLSAGATVSSFSAKTNIDSLVDHVRALAMDHRPSTPGSHIDWAGDEDDSLPDLDDWGVPHSSGTSADANPCTTESLDKARLQLMSPILDDSLKQLPQNFDKASPRPRSALVHCLTGALSSAAEVDGLEGHSPPLPESSPQPDIAPALTDPNTGASKDTPSHLVMVSLSVPRPHPPPPPEEHDPEFDPDASQRGLAASMHALKSSSSESGLPEEPRSVPPLRNATHGRSRTLGRPPPFSAAGTKHNFHSGSSTSVGAAVAKGINHARTQSTPPSAAFHRRQHSRPIITTDAMSRLAKTLGTALPKTEVTTTNLAATSE